ncbi:hypothetical protein DAPPUDRAFT_126323, partial [Daphnia pulex]
RVCVRHARRGELLPRGAIVEREGPNTKLELGLHTDNRNAARGEERRVVNVGNRGRGPHVHERLTALDACKVSHVDRCELDEMRNRGRVVRRVHHVEIGDARAGGERAGTSNVALHVDALTLLQRERGAVPRVPGERRAPFKVRGSAHEAQPPSGLGEDEERRGGGEAREHRPHGAIVERVRPHARRGGAGTHERDAAQRVAILVVKGVRSKDIGDVLSVEHVAASVGARDHLGELGVAASDGCVVADHGDGGDGGGARVGGESSHTCDPRHRGRDRADRLGAVSHIPRAPRESDVAVVEGDRGHEAHAPPVADAQQERVRVGQ